MTLEIVPVELQSPRIGWYSRSPRLATGPSLWTPVVKTIQFSTFVQNFLWFFTSHV